MYASALALMCNVAYSNIERQTFTINIDDNGLMRRSDTGQPTLYFGTNYTLPFAHAWRATGAMNLDRKIVADRDIYHFKRMGLNAFRLHLWDVELSDSVGNLLENEHLDLLDYTLAELGKEGIDIILTAQTNFGNGYPEKNIDTGAFSYDYDKCEIHENPTAQKIQERYLTTLMKHRNPYTGLTYGEDKSIIAVEINNEPCHSGTPKQVTNYINRMVKALHKGGFDRIVLYNVSHNSDVTEAYYDADIQGTTYQWYPDGLVAGHERKGNLLPYVDEYPVPWKERIKNYPKMAKVVYEFDPGDVLCSYLYPAMVRTFRKEGFQWATQFAYDPTPLAPYNTEYQTHYLNLLYTPSKAISMAVAARAMKEIEDGSDFGSFPQDTVFGNFRVSYLENLSEYNSPEVFIHTNNTHTSPKDIYSVRNIWGVGSSPVAEYSGTGAYFLDRYSVKDSETDVWRLEVLPDAVILRDPFEKPTPDKEVARLFFNSNDLTLHIPSLGTDFFATSVENPDMTKSASEGHIEIEPGVYLLGKDAEKLRKIVKGEIALTDGSYALRDDELKRFAAEGLHPDPERESVVLKHTPLPVFVRNTGLNPDSIVIDAEIYSDVPVEAVKIYPSTVSFWSKENPITEMQPRGRRFYTAVLPADATGPESLDYNIVVFTADGKASTWSEKSDKSDGSVAGTPLDWDYDSRQFYSTRLVDYGTPVILMKATPHDPQLEISMIPERWDYRLRYDEKDPLKPGRYVVSLPDVKDLLTLRRYVGDELVGDTRLKSVDNINILLSDYVPESVDMEVGIIGKNGITYTAPLNSAEVKNSQTGKVYTIPISRLSQTATQIIPTPHPAFLPRIAPETTPEPLDISEIDFIEIRLSGNSSPVEIVSAWLSK